MSSAVSETGDWLRLLSSGEVTVLGQMPWSSNATFLVEVRVDDLEGRAIYKPRQGERPLRDFPGGLFRREIAAYELSVATGLDVIPETVEREDGPLGPGSFQRFIDADFAEHYFTLMEAGGHGLELKLIAGFDLLANNADRKGGHLLIDRGGRIWGIDNGLCFHVYNKLRTVMWDFAGEALPEKVLQACEIVLGEPPPRLTELLDGSEVIALVERAQFYLQYRTYPAPEDDYRAYPWPLV